MEKHQGFFKRLHIQYKTCIPCFFTNSSLTMYSDCTQIKLNYLKTITQTVEIFHGHYKQDLQG